MEGALRYFDLQVGEEEETSKEDEKERPEKQEKTKQNKTGECSAWFPKPQGGCYQ